MSGEYNEQIEMGRGPEVKHDCPYPTERGRTTIYSADEGHFTQPVSITTEVELPEGTGEQLAAQLRLLINSLAIGDKIGFIELSLRDTSIPKAISDEVFAKLQKNAVGALYRGEVPAHYRKAGRRESDKSDHGA